MSVPANSALGQLKGSDSIFEIYTESYGENWSFDSYSVEKGWVFGWVKKGFKDKKNKDLWMQYLALHKLHHIKFIWIKGHNDHPENEVGGETEAIFGKKEKC